jgi:hypothetical protein
VIDRRTAAEIDDERVQRLVHHDVMRLKVPMEYRPRSKKAQPLRYFVGNSQPFLKRKGLTLPHQYIQIVNIGSHKDKILLTPLS